MATQATTARGRAIATQDAAITSNVAKIEEAKRNPSAIETMAGKYQMTASSLQSTLMNTVFRGASEAEFRALIVVSNAYGLNPLTKEIYAFPGKGGITPIVSVDGWIRITNEHPQFDGIEFNDIVDERGELYAIESIIYRRDRTHPIKVTEYMDECKGNGPGWQKTPKRMLRHRALIQGARIAFGFSGIYAEGDEPEVRVQQDGGELARNISPPRRDVPHDAETGEISEDEARELDRQGFAAMEGLHTEEPEDKAALGTAALIARIEACTEAAEVMAITTDPAVGKQRAWLSKNRPDLTAQVDAAIVTALDGLGESQSDADHGRTFDGDGTRSDAIRGEG